MSARLRWDDPTAVADWLVALRTAFTDADDTARDMLLPLRRRRLGQRLHRALYSDAAKSVRTLLDFAEPPPEEPEPSDPAGCGSSPAD